VGIKLLSDMTEITVQGDRAENVINGCICSGIAVSSAERVDVFTVKLSVHESDAKKVKEICRRNMCDVLELRPSGMSLARNTARQRASLAVTAAFFTALLLASSLFIWKIDIEGNTVLTEGEILRELSRCGVDIGAYWPSVKADKVRSAVLRELSDAAWLTVNVSGSRAKVIILEKSDAPEVYDEYAPADIIAATDGVITDISVLNGYSELSRGSTVTAGETLIKGTVGSIAGEERKLRAKGEVWADTVRTLTAVCPLLTSTEKGDCRKYASLKIGKRRINIGAESGKSIDGCDKITTEYKMGIKDLFALPLSLLITQTSDVKPCGHAGADMQAVKARLLCNLDGAIDGKVLSYEFSSYTEETAVYITLTARCNENIAKLSESAYTAP